MKFEFKMNNIRQEKGDLPFSRAEACKYIKLDERPVLYTHGIPYRGPSVYKKPISKEEAIKIINSATLMNIRSANDYINLNTYSELDMW